MTQQHQARASNRRTPARAFGAAVGRQHPMRGVNQWTKPTTNQPSQMKSCYHIKPLMHQNPLKPATRFKPGRGADYRRHHSKEHV